MKKSLSPVGMFVGGVVTALVITGGGVAYAANGGSLVIGKANTASKVTSLSNGGTPLKLTSRNGAAPLKVSGSKKVLKLNADKVDGIDFRTARTRVLGAYGSYVDLNADGVVDIFGSAAQCPRGTLLTGGGVDDYTDGVVVWNSPTDDGTGWVAAVAGDSGTSTAQDLQAYAVCYNPYGGPTGTTFSAASHGTFKVSAEDRADLLRAVAAKTR